MDTKREYDFETLHRYLPPYRSLLSPNTRYDYMTHQLLHDNTDFHLNISSQSKKEKIKMKYRSLLTPINDTRKKLLIAADSLSIRSFKSVVREQKEQLTFANLPKEVGIVIFGFLQDDTKSLVNCLYVNRQFNDLAKHYLYKAPFLTSTYRVGQFLNVIMNDEKLAKMVEVLDLSRLAPGVDEDENYNILVDLLNSREMEDSFVERMDSGSLAGWRDWKFRDHPLYGRRTETRRRRSSVVSSGNSLFSNGNNSSDSTDLFRSISNSSTEYKRGKVSSLKKTFKKVLQLEHREVAFEPHYVYKPVVEEEQTASQSPYSKPHPVANKFLVKYCFSKDLPVGYIIHFVQECENLRVLNLSNLSLTPDFQMKDYEFFDWNTGKGKIKTPLKSGIGYQYNSMLLDTTKTHEEYHPPPSKPVFLSDTTLREVKLGCADHSKVTYGEILSEIAKLESLTELHICSLIWISKTDVYNFVEHSVSVRNANLKLIDASDSGMARGLPWARRRTIKEWHRFIRDSQLERNVNTVNVLLETMGEDY